MKFDCNKEPKEEEVVARVTSLSLDIKTDVGWVRIYDNYAGYRGVEGKPWYTIKEYRKGDKLTITF